MWLPKRHRRDAQPQRRSSPNPLQPALHRHRGRPAEWGQAWRMYDTNAAALTIYRQLRVACSLWGRIALAGVFGKIGDRHYLLYPLLYFRLQNIWIPTRYNTVSVANLVTREASSRSTACPPSRDGQESGGNPHVALDALVPVDDTPWHRMRHVSLLHLFPNVFVIRLPNLVVYLPQPFGREIFSLLARCPLMLQSTT